MRPFLAALAALPLLFPTVAHVEYVAGTGRGVCGGWGRG